MFSWISLIAVIAIEQFGMDPEQNGMMLSYIGAISLFMQGIGISTLTKRADDKALMALSTVTLTVSYFVMVRCYKLAFFFCQIDCVDVRTCQFLLEP